MAVTDWPSCRWATETMDASVLVSLLVLGLGCLLGYVITGNRERTGVDRMLGSLVWGPGLAAGALSLASFFSLASGWGQIGRIGLLATLVIPIVAGWWMTTRLRPECRVPVDDHRGRGVWLGSMAMALLAVGYGWASLRWLADRPLGSFDGMGIWTYRALQWFRSGDVFPETLGMMLESKPGYPLLLPGLITSQYTLWGGESTTIPVVTGWFFVISVGAACILAVKRWAPLSIALAAAVLLLSTPMMWRWAFAQSADLALASLALAAAYGLSELVTRDRKGATPPWLVGFFLGLMVWTKDEGLFLSIIMAAVAVVCARFGGGRVPGRRWLGVLVGALPGLVATAVLKIAWAPAGEVHRYLGAGGWSRLADPGRWRDVAGAFANRLIPWSGEGLWGGTLVVLFVVLVIAVSLHRSGGFGLGVMLYGVPVVLAAGLDATAYLLTPEPLEWHLRTSLDRLLLQLLPMALVAVFVAFGRSLRESENPETR
jgi:hypothetical protein